VKHRMIFFYVLVMACVLSGCGSVARESAFMVDFALASLIEANEQYLIAPHTVSGGTVSEPPAPFFQKHEEAIVQIDLSQIPAFMEAVRSDIESALTDSGAQITGSGGDQPEIIEQALAIASEEAEIRSRQIDHQGREGSLANITGFSFRYTDGEIDGAINVWGVRGEGTSFVLIALITES
jgi:hypothetical protein